LPKHYDVVVVVVVVPGVVVPGVVCVVVAGGDIISHPPLVPSTIIRE
jgi:hypothetical protein